MTAQQLTKVWNDNAYPYQETFKGEPVEIPAKGFVEMDPTEAEEFRGGFKAPIIRGDGTHDPRGYKMIRLEHPPRKPKPVDPLMNHLTGQIAANVESLRAELASYKHLLVEDPKAQEEALAEKESLRAEIAELRDAMKEILANQGKKKGQ